MKRRSYIIKSRSRKRLKK